MLWEKEMESRKRVIEVWVCVCCGVGIYNTRKGDAVAFLRK